MVRLCFDYGHGGKDSGAIYKSRKESNDNLDIGMEVAKRVRIFGKEIVHQISKAIIFGTEGQELCGTQLLSLCPINSIISERCSQ